MLIICYYFQRFSFGGSWSVTEESFGLTGLFPFHLFQLCFDLSNDYKSKLVVVLRPSMIRFDFSLGFV